MEFRLCANCRRIEGSGTLCPSCGGRLELAEPEVLVGQVFGKYTLENVLGAGGMGVVYGARHATLGRLVALKMILSGVADEAFLKRFLQEARVLAELKHPNIVEVYDFDVSEWGPPFMVMEFLEGRSLREILEQQKAGLALPDYASLILEIGAALGYAHKRGVVHRDLKPENIFVAVYDGVPVGKVLDFGLAKLLRAPNLDDRLTATGAVMGTPHYLAPEQILCRPVSPQSDQYALALVVAEMAAGKAVRAGKSFSEICATEASRPLSDDWAPERLPPGPLRDALRRGTDPDPMRRYADISSFISALGLIASARSSSRLASAARTSAAIPTIALTPPSTPLRSPSPRPLSSTPNRSDMPTRSVPPPAAPVSSKRKFSGRHLAFAAGALAVILAVAAAFTWHKRTQTGKREEAPGATSQRIWEKLASLPVPADVTGLITRNEEKRVSILGAQGGVYLISEAGDPPARVPLQSGEEIVAGAEDGKALLRSGDRLVLRDFLQQKDQVIAEKVPKAENFWISPRWDFLACEVGGELAVFRIEARTCKQCARISVPKEASRWVLLGERHLVVHDGGKISAFTLPEGRVLWQREMEAGLIAGALEEPGGLLALGGWTDQVYLLDLDSGKERRAFSRKGRTNGLAFIPGGEKLAAAGEGGLLVFPTNGGAAESSLEGQEGCLQEAVFSGGLLATLDTDRHRLELITYHGLPPLRSIEAADKELWALAADPLGRWIYAGSSKGTLARVGPESGKAEEFPLHTQGLTGLVASKDYVASSSDDRTIAVWAVPQMNVVWRSKAHDYLINGLFLSKAPQLLWSASSDGTIKAWNWPQLEERETISSAKVLGKPLSLAAIWASSDGNRVLAGSWSGKLLDLTKDEKDGWRGRVWETPSECLYSAAEIPGAQAVVFGGLGWRPGVFVYDLKEGKLSEAESLDVELGNAYAAATGKDGEVCVAGSGLVLLYHFDRSAEGPLRYSVRCVADSSLRAAGSAVAVPNLDAIAFGAVGKIHLVPLASLRGAPQAEETLP